MSLKTDYKNDILNTEVNTNRKFNMIQNQDGTVSFVDVTEYDQHGDNFGASDINATNHAVNQINANLTATYDPITKKWYELVNGQRGSEIKMGMIPNYSDPITVTNGLVAPRDMVINANAQVYYGHPSLTVKINGNPVMSWTENTPSGVVWEANGAPFKFELSEGDVFTWEGSGTLNAYGFGCK